MIFAGCRQMAEKLLSIFTASGFTIFRRNLKEKQLSFARRAAVL
jgi:hypothetical protein